MGCGCLHFLNEICFQVETRCGKNISYNVIKKKQGEKNLSVSDTKFTFHKSENGKF